MREAYVLIVVGAVLFLAGLAKLGGSQSGGFKLSNFGINIGGTNSQTNEVGNVTPGEAPPSSGSSSAVWGDSPVTVTGCATGCVTPTRVRDGICTFGAVHKGLKGSLLPTPFPVSEATPLWRSPIFTR